MFLFCGIVVVVFLNINKIFKSSNGLLWYGSNGTGLIRYDGNSFINYNKYHDIENFFITDIAEHKGELLLLTKYRGLLVFNGQQFTKIIDYKVINDSVDVIQKIVKIDTIVYGVSKKRIYSIEKNNKIHPLLSIEGKAINTINGVTNLDNNCLLIATEWSEFKNPNFELMASTFNIRHERWEQAA